MLTTTTKKEKQELIDYVNEQAYLADKSSHEWAAAGDDINGAYRNGMWYAYNDIRNRL